MSDIKLFRLGDPKVEELQGSSVSIEKALQVLLEKDLEAFLGVRFLSSEHATGKTHGGRIDTLGIDENDSPVIIEYKRSSNENVINQGLYYLDWLLDHKAEFELLTMRRLGRSVADAIDWSAPRLVCIAGDFTKYDQHAVQQINRSIELVRYRSYEGFLILELVNAPVGGSGGAVEPTRSAKGVSRPTKSVTEYLGQAPPALKARFEELERHVLALGDDVSRKDLKFYFAYRRIKNFACVEVHPQSEQLLLYLKVDPGGVVLEDGFTRDVRKIGHFGTGDLEVRIRTAADLERSLPLIGRSYDAS